MAADMTEKGILPDYERASSPDEIDAKSIDADALKLIEMGYKQEMKRDFSVWSVLGVGFSLTNSWFGISAAFVTGIFSGGPVCIVYGIILIALISTCVGISLSELASAMPNAGGQYFWANELAPKRYSSFLAYLTGALAWWGSIFTSASVALAVGNAAVGCISLAHPNLVFKRWMGFVGYQIINLFAYFFNTYGKTLPKTATFTLYTSLVSFFVIMVTVLAKSHPKQPARAVFAEFTNATGWSSSGIAFIVGLVNSNWAFACLDCATHMAEEVAHPEKMIPIAIMGTVAIGFGTAWLFSISIFFSMKDLTAITGTLNPAPILILFDQALDSVAGAIVLEVLIILTGIGCQIACHTWQARLCWSFARDRGLPGSQIWAKVDPRLGVPLYAHSMSCTIVAILGLLYIGSSTAFFSMVTACIVLLYISYAIPVVCLLIKGRNNIEHGPFWMGSFGLFANCVLLAWTCFTLVMYSLPVFKPVLPGNMNYVSAVYGVVFTFVIGYWFVRGRRTFRQRDERHHEADVTLHHARASVSAQGEEKIVR